MTESPILFSMCLAGINCRYDGKSSKPSIQMQTLIKKRHMIPICPEQLGGLPTPRIPSEILIDINKNYTSTTVSDININNNSGYLVWSDQAHVYRKDDKLNVTLNFQKGAQESLKLAKQFSAKTAILKDNSPSCGVYNIYDGTFTGKKILGCGVTTALFQKEGIKCLSDTEYDDIEELLNK